MSDTGQIYALLPKIIGDISPIAKARKNQQQGYSFRGVDDVYGALNELLAKHGVTIIPRLVELEESHWDNAKGNKVFRVKTTFEYDFYAPDGSHVTARIPSEAMDTGDKATPKALSMAYKYMAFQVFCIPLDEGLDTETQTHDIRGRAEQQRREPPPRQEPPPAAEPPAEPDNAESAKLLAGALDAIAKAESPDRLKEILTNINSRRKWIRPDKIKALGEVYSKWISFVMTDKSYEEECRHTLDNDKTLGEPAKQMFRTQIQGAIAHALEQSAMEAFG